MADADQGLGLVGGDGHGQEVALTVLAAHGDQQVALDLGFDAFGDDVEVQGAGDADDALDQSEPLVGDGDPVDERLVDLEDVDGELAQVAQG